MTTAIAIKIAKLNGSDLPIQFRYSPYIQRKRNSVTQTVNGVVIQAPSPQIVPGDGILAWTIECALPTEFQTLYNLYNTSGLTGYNFKGYWGEEYTILFSEFDPPKVNAKLFDLSGQFQVIAIIHDFNADCN